MPDFQKQKMTFDVRSKWINHLESVAYCETAGKSATIRLDELT